MRLRRGHLNNPRFLESCYRSGLIIITKSSLRPPSIIYDSQVLVSSYMKQRRQYACGPCRKNHRRCSGDGPPCTACRTRRVSTKCTIPDSSRLLNGSMPLETAPLSGTGHDFSTIQSREVPSSTDTEQAAISGENFEQPTRNQYLLVLIYLFVASRDPYDKETISRIIVRDDEEWEKSFSPQYQPYLSWWLTIRCGLTQHRGILAVSIEDMIQQIKYLLYLIGRLSTPQSNLFHSQWESQNHPSRPFGMNASIALICYCFNGTKDVQGYESLDIWSYNEGFLFTMVIQLRLSPTFGDSISLTQVKHMISSVRTALAGEDTRTLFSPWHIPLDNSAVTLRYYQRAIKTLNPELLPKILSRWAKTLPRGELLPRVEKWNFDDQAMIGMDHQKLDI